MPGFLLILGALLLTSAAAFGQDSQPSAGIFSSAAASIAGAYADHRAVTVPSPDGFSRVLARARDRNFVLEVEGRIGPLKLDIADGPNAEIGWSPDSQAFFVTENDGGLASAYLLTVVGRVNDRLVVRHLSKFIVTAFDHPVRCFEPEDPNVAGVAWLGSSQALLVAAQVPFRSNCDSMGMFAAYDVDPWRMAVLRTYAQLEAKSLFRSALGPRLLSASDECVRNPGACYIPQLHSGTGRD
jgi:hypothetical protein